MSDDTENTNLAAYCGLYCGACEVYRLQQEALEQGRVPEWNELPERLRKSLPFKPAPIQCHGCRSDQAFGHCAHCFFRNCARNKGNVDFCMNCASNPCLKTRLFGVLARLFSLEKKLPHLMGKRANLERIRSVGTSQWLREQAEAWRCPDCQTPFSWYREVCRKCGKDLRAIARERRGETG